MIGAMCPLFVEIFDTGFPLGFASLEALLRRNGRDVDIVQVTPVAASIGHPWVMVVYAEAPR